MKKSHYAMLAVYAAVLAWSGYKPHDYFTWFLEVMPALIALAIIVFTWNRFRFTALVYWLITIH